MYTLYMYTHSCVLWYSCIHPLCPLVYFVPLCVYRYRVKVIVELREYFLRKQREEEERVKQAKLAEIKRMYDAAFSIQRMARAHMVRLI